jgi:hypothetical protein
LQLDDTPVPAGQEGARWLGERRGSGPWRDYPDDPANMDYPTSSAPAPRPDGYRPGYRGGYAARPPAGQPPWPPAPGRHAAARRRGIAPELVQPAAVAAAPGFGQRMRSAARNHTGAAALTAAALVGTGVGVGMFGFAPFSPPSGTPAGATAAMPAAAPPVVSMAGSATPVQHHTGYLGKHRKAEPRPPAHATHQLSGSAGGAAAAAPPAAHPQSTGGGGSAPAGSSGAAPSPHSSASSTPRASRGGGSGSQTGTGSGGGTGRGHSGGEHSGSGSLVGGLTGLLGGLGL